MFESFRANQRYRKLVRFWIGYRDMVQRFEGAKGVTDSHEKRFLRLKARIAGLLPVLESRAPASMAREAQRRTMLMTDLLNRHRSLRREEAPNEKEREEFSKTWHEHYIFLNQLKGVPVVREKSDAPKRPKETPTGIPGRRIRRSSPVLRFLGFVLRVGVVGVAIYLLGRAFGFHWGEARGLQVDAPTSVSGVGANVWHALQSVWAGLVSFLQPVIGTYGLEATIALVGILLIALGYWFFIRGK